MLKMDNLYYVNLSLYIIYTSFGSPVFAGPPSLRYGGLTSFAHLLRSGYPAQPVDHSLLGGCGSQTPAHKCFIPGSKPFVAYVYSMLNHVSTSFLHFWLSIHVC